METTRKSKLIESLQKAVTALKTDTIHYKWSDTLSCNCGVVSQSILGLTKGELNNAVGDIFDMKKQKAYFSVNEKDLFDTTWKNAVKMYCPITEKPLRKIFIDLHNAGLRKEDIAHLEYLENPAILQKSGIKTTTSLVVIEKKVTSTTTRKTWYGSKITTENITEVENKKEVPYPYYAVKENLIKYLSAWVEILKEETTEPILEQISDLIKLEEMELIAVADERYEDAAKCRNKIISLNLAK